MEIAFIHNRCASCGKQLLDGEAGIILGDIKIQESGLVNFTPGMDTRNVYCSIFCVQKDLDKNIKKH